MSTDQEGYEHLRAVYFEECHELLEVVDERLLRLDSGDFDKEDLNAIFRAVHSIKGGSGAFGLTALSKFVHTFENVLDLMRSDELAVRPEEVDLLFRAKDVLAELVELSQNQEEIPEELGSEVLKELKALAEVGSGESDAKEQEGSAEADGPWIVDFWPSSQITEVGGEPLFLLYELLRLKEEEVEVSLDISRLPMLEGLEVYASYLGWHIKLPAGIEKSRVDEVFEFVSDICELNIELEEGAVPSQESKASEEDEEDEAFGLFTENMSEDLQAVQEEVAKKPQEKKEEAKKEPSGNGNATASKGVQSIRVELDKIDRLVNMVGELVITQAMLAQQAGIIPEEKYPGLFNGLDQLSYHTRDLQESVMSIRAQPVRSVFSRMPRLVRDTSKALGKEIQLVMTGEGTEVDRTVIEQLSDPLTHMIRNALDHGIEFPDEREATGKDRSGTIFLSAEHRSGKIVISVSDDGKGIDGQKLLRKAKDKNLVSEDTQMSDEQALELIFLPGFSTAEEVSDISGRGVGMDVVRRNIQDLNGRISLQSKIGQGTKVIMSLPLTLAVLDGMVVQIGEEKYVLPLLSIVESFRPKKDDLQPVMDRFDIVRVREENVPLVYLHELLEIDSAKQNPWDALVVVVEVDGGEKIGLVVDELLGERQVVIKTLENNYGRVEGCAAATILGDGQVALILDITDIYRLVQKQAEYKKMRSRKHDRTESTAS